MEVDDVNAIKAMMTSGDPHISEMTIDDWMLAFDRADHDMKRLMLFVNLPKLCSKCELNGDQTSLLIQKMPVNLLSEFLLEGDEECVDFVVTILKVLLPQTRSDVLPALRPLIEGIRSSLCQKKQISVSDFNDRVSVLRSIGLQFLSVDDLNSLLNASVAYLKDNVEKLPSDEITTFIVAAQKQLCGYLSDDKEFNSIALSWPANIKVVAQRLFQTYNIDDRFTNFSFITLSLTAQICGSSWLSSPAQFLRLISSLCAGRLRIITEYPDKIDVDMLAACLSLLECAVRCVEVDTTAVSDEVATAVSRSCKEGASFCFEYLSACHEKKIHLPLECLLGFYRFICMFASVGGIQLIQKEYVEGAISSLVNTCNFALDQRDTSTATLLLNNLPEFPQLPNNTLDVLFKYIRLSWPTAERKTAIEMFTSVIGELKDRNDFYTKESRINVLQFAHDAENQTLIDVLKKLKE
ncbi:hypothetical protein M3Y95_00566500 [Aphelenchoides besseyi]|nr:hypothetical protein M3Y95_00566500 [Aphelenchoides besseyi]